MTTSKADDDMYYELHEKEFVRMCLRSKRNIHNDIAVMTRAAGQFTAPLLGGMARETKLDFLQCSETQRVVSSPQLAIGTSYTIQLECGHNGKDTAPYQSKLYYL